MKKIFRISLIVILIFLNGNLIAQGAGSAIFFDGINDYVESFGNIGVTGSDERTAFAWVKSAQLYSTACCPTPFSWGAPSVGMGFGNFIGSGIWWFWGYQDDINTSANVNLEWNHHCITYDGTTIVYYLNGNIITSGNKNLNTAASKLIVGDGFDHRVDTPFNGVVDEVRVWKKVLAPNEIRELVFRKLTPQEKLDTNLVCYWRFNNGMGSTTPDSSNYNNHGMLTNMDTTSAWVNSTVPLATELTETMVNISAVWAGLDSNNSSIMSIVDNDISGDNAVIFGHNNNSIIFDTTDVPTNKGILLRLKRIWRLETYGTLTGNIIFNISNLGFTNTNAIKLLIDDNGTFTDADTASGMLDSTRFNVTNEIFQNGYYYTLGLTEYPVKIKLPFGENISNNFHLSQNFPNPFNPSTTIKYYLLISQYVELNIYNVMGQKIRTLVNKSQNADSYEVVWDGTDDRGRLVSSGVYFYQLKTETTSQNHKMILLR